jgi:YrbI family 3-deoxy-D-manno-octulosonate 8-phosphate phosphatase
MKSIGFIPLRKDSKGIVGKNKRKLLGRPLFSWVLTEAVFSELDEVFVYCNDQSIKDFINKEYSWTSKIRILARSEDSATDIASTEKAIIEFCGQIDYSFDVFCLLQATSPFTKSEDINRSLLKIKEGKDSVLSAVKSHRFLWDSKGVPVNYNYMQRPRRQDFEGNLVENGAIYTTKREALQKSKNRISGEIGVIEMPEESFYEIDTLTDWNIVENLLFSRLRSNRIPTKINHLFLDVDGVFTDGKVLYSQNGEFAKSFDMRDGMGLEVLRETGIEVSVMTSEDSALVASRMKKLNIDKVYLGIKDKFGLIKQLSKKYNFDLRNIAYLGDDINDMACMASAGWAITPLNAMEEIKRIADLTLKFNSGSGAIREACNFINKYNKRFD